MDDVELEAEGLVVKAITIQVNGRNRHFVAAEDLPDRTLLSPLQLTGLMSACTALDLTRADRLELAQILLGRDVESFKYLTAYEAQRLADALNGYSYVWTIRNNKTLRR